MDGPAWLSAYRDCTSLLKEVDHLCILFLRIRRGNKQRKNSENEFNFRKETWLSYTKISIRSNIGSWIIMKKLNAC